MALTAGPHSTFGRLVHTPYVRALFLRCAMSDAISRLTKLRTMNYKSYLATPEWRERRESAVLAAKGKCSLCNKVGKSIHVHHRTYERRGMELPSDLVALCDKCHAKHHNKDKSQSATVDKTLLRYEARMAKHE